MLFGGARVREVPNQLSRQLVDFGASEIVKFFAFGTENRRTEDGRYADSPAIEDISVHRKVSYFPFAFSASSASRSALRLGFVGTASLMDIEGLFAFVSDDACY